MITRKNIYHYIVYMIFAFTYFCCIGLYCVSVSGEKTGSSLVIGLIVRYVLCFVIPIGAIFAYRLIYDHIPAKFVPDKMPVFTKRTEGIFVGSFSLIALFLRIFVITAHIGEDINNVFYDYAFLRADILPTNEYISFLYGRILRLLVRIHPSEYPIYVFNGILQVGTAALLYYTLKKAFRIRYAIAGYVLLTFTPVSMSHVIYINSDSLQAFFIALYMFYLVFLNVENKNGKIDESYKVLFYVGLGIFCAYILRLDKSNVVIPLITLTSLLMIYHKEATKKIQKRYFQILVFLASFLLFFVIFLSVMRINNLSFEDGMTVYFNSFSPRGLTLKLLYFEKTRPEGLVVYMLFVPFILLFLRRYTDKGLFAALLFVAYNIFTFVDLKSPDYSYLAEYMAAMCASIGVFAIPLISAKDEELDEEEREETLRLVTKEKERAERKAKIRNKKESIRLEKDAAYNERRLQRKQEFEEVRNEREARLIEKRELKNDITSLEYRGDDIATSNNLVYEADKGDFDMFSKNQEQGISLVDESSKNNDNSNFIKNPLPTPKPHVSRELCYDYDLKPSDMDFDIKDLKGKDYYDI